MKYLRPNEDYERNDREDNYIWGYGEKREYSDKKKKRRKKPIWDI